MRKAVFLGVIVLIALVISSTGTRAQITPEEREAAINAGLGWLANQQHPTDWYFYDPDVPNYYRVALTAFAVLKFEEYAQKTLGIDPFSDDYDYKDEIVKGLDYIFEHAYSVNIMAELAVCPFHWCGPGFPDADGDAIGIYFVSDAPDQRPNYETGIVMMAIQASCHPERKVTTGPFINFTYHDILVDAVDYYAWAQNEDDLPDGSGPGPRSRGGWGYVPNNGDPGPFLHWGSDNPINQWVVLGLMSAAEWGINPTYLNHVKSELRDTDGNVDLWLRYSQDFPGSGGFGYWSPSDPNIARTASGLVQLTYCGHTTPAIRWNAARGYIGTNWGSDNIGNLYAMYSVMKAAVTAKGENVVYFDSHNWQDEYDEWIRDNQVKPDGYWPGQYAHGGNRVLATVWSLLILEKEAPRLPDVMIHDCEDDNGSVPTYYDCTIFYPGPPPHARWGITYLSPDIKIGLPWTTPPYNPRYQNLVANETNRLYAYVKNIGSADAHSVYVTFYRTDFSISPTTIYEIGPAPEIPVLPPGATQEVHFDWDVPCDIPKSQCIVVTVDCEKDPLVSQDPLISARIHPWDNNVAIRNLTVLPPGGIKTKFKVGNPDTLSAHDVFLHLFFQDWPSAWTVELTSPDTQFVQIDDTTYVFYSMDPQEEREATTSLNIPEGTDKDTGTVHILGTIDDESIGGISVQFRYEPTKVLIPNTETCVNPGDYVSLPILLENNTAPFGGFELEVEFDYTSMCFVSAEPGELIEGFELFTYRLLPCPVPLCQKYKILLYGQYDIPNGAGNIGDPIPMTSLGEYRELVNLNFVINNDENLRGLMIPVCWEWEGVVEGDSLVVEDWDCAENTFSDETGNILYTSNLRCQFNPDICDDPTGQIDPVLIFQDGVCGQNCGGVDVCPAGPGACKRGDVNYNAVTYEVADAVLFARYFVEGLSVFSDDPDTRAYQVCASDVNADGRSLTLSDFVYLIRVILHDAPEIPMKLAPSSEIANVIVHDGIITTECASPIGAILFEFDGTVVPTLLASDMEMRHHHNKVLVWSREGETIKAMSEVLSFTGDAELTSVSAVDYDTRELKTSIVGKRTPIAFALNPAYPNPFNPFTNLSFTLPEALAYSLKIYNVAGQLVRSYEGMGSAGLNVISWDSKDNAGDEVASGIYFYKLTAGGFSATRKMVVIK